MDKSLIELSEKFRHGQVNRREFIQRVVVLAGGAAAAAPLLHQLGFDSGLIREANALGSNIETMDVEFPSGGDLIPAYLAKPVGPGPFRTMIVIHEIYGLSNFIRDVARLIARNKYLALAPCFSEGNCTGGLPDGKHAQWMLDTLQTGIARVPDDEQDKLRDAYAFLSKREDVDPDHIGSVGFCWGGARSFTFATLNPKLWAAVVFYGSTPPLDDLNNINSPVLALYGALDNSTPTSITGRAAETAREMRVRSPKPFEWEVYNQAVHGFFRAGTPPDDHVADTRPALIAKDLMFDFLDRYYDRG